jgi:hypothetical protein
VLEWPHESSWFPACLIADRVCFGIVAESRGTADMLTGRLRGRWLWCDGIVNWGRVFHKFCRRERRISFFEHALVKQGG